MAPFLEHHPPTHVRDTRHWKDCHQPHSQQTAVLAGNTLRISSDSVPPTLQAAGPIVFLVRGNLLKLLFHVNQPPHNTGPATGPF